MDKNNNMHEGHRERIRQRLINGNLESFESHEILEFLLCYSISRQDVNALAHRLLERFGNLESVLCASVEELSRTEGLGIYSAQWLNLVGRYVKTCSSNCFSMTAPVVNWHSLNRELPQMRSIFPSPCCVQILLDENFHVIHRHLLCRGTQWTRPEILTAGLNAIFSSNACQIILIIFSDTAHPKADENLIYYAREYSHALTLCDRRLRDVIISGTDASVSLWRLGILQNEEKPKFFKTLPKDFFCEDTEADE